MEVISIFFTCGIILLPFKNGHSLLGVNKQAIVRELLNFVSLEACYLDFDNLDYWFRGVCTQ
jgi:hypothetical protein